MNTPSPSPVSARNSFLPTGAAIIVAGLLAGCTTPEKKPEFTFEMPKKIDTTSILVQKSLSEHAEELATDIAEKINNHPEFHSLRRIKLYLSAELKKR
jgi:hypothetical protein